MKRLSLLNRTGELRRFIGGLFAVWTLIVAGSLLWNLGSEYEETLETARTYARTAYEKDVLYRAWNSMHGGVYAPATESSPPNPYLEVEERDITTPSGVPLTLINPAYMTRQVHELFAERSSILGHITSLKALRPENAPDAWEAEVLRSFESGEDEASSLETIDGVMHMRLMRPLVTEESCLKCHEHQGYVVGDIRGGISVSVPMAPLWEMQRAYQWGLFAGHGLIWFIGAFGILWTGAQLTRHADERDQAQQEIQHERDFTEAIFNTAGALIIVVDEEGRVIRLNSECEKVTSYESDELIGEKPWDWIIAPEDVDAFKAAFDDLIEGGHYYNEGESVWIAKGGTRHPVAWTNTLLTDPTGAVRYVISAGMDISKRKQAEDALQRFRAALDVSADSIFLIDYASGLFVDVNDTACRKMGYSREELLSMHPWEIKPYYEREDLYEHFDKVLQDQNNENGILETVHRRKDGSEFPVEVFLRPLRDSGSPLIIASVRDITERVEAEQALIDERQRLYRLLDELPAFVSLQTEDYQVRFANRYYKERLGSPDGRLCHQLTYGRDEPCEFCPLNIITREKIPQDMEGVLADGRTYHLYYYPFEDVDGSDLILVLGIDVTERVHAEDALRESEERYRLVSEIISDYAYALEVQPDNSLKLGWVTEAFNRITGYNMLNIFKNGYWGDFVHPEDRQKVATQMQKLLLGVTSVTEYRVITQDEQTRWLRDYGRPVWDEAERRVIRVIGAAQDITHRKQAEQERERLIHELDAFAHTVAHDLKNPLGTIEGFAEILLEDWQDLSPDLMTTYLDAVMQSAHKSISIVEELLLLAGVRQTQVRIAPLDMEQIVKSTMERLIYMVREYQADVILPESWPVALGYAPWVEEVWTNYISNAIKYGGRPPRIEIGGEDCDDGLIRFWVRDNGEGIPKEDAARLFTPFTQLNQVKNVEGHGLGLSIVQRIIEKLGGDVGVESVPGEGSTFFFTLYAQHCRQEA